MPGPIILSPPRLPGPGPAEDCSQAIPSCDVLDRDREEAASSRKQGHEDRLL